MAELRFRGKYMASVEVMNLQSPPRWYATYTAPRHEKSVQQHLENRSVENFLPLYQSARLWNGRRAVVQLPLFPGYLFVRIPVEQRVRVLEVPGVLNIVNSNGRLNPLPEGEVEALRAALQMRRSEPHPLLVRGKKVRIKGGPLRGLEGVVVRQTHKLRMVVSIDCIMQSFAVELEASDLESDVLTASRQAA
jgi:transcription antitermination factor NusG